MEIRDTETVKRYNEAKKFVKQYEQQYCLALVSGSCFDTDIWNWRYEIQYRLDRLKELGQLEKQTDSEKLDKLIGHLYEKFGKEKIETVKNLISSTPNDQELGEKVREMFR